MTNGSSGGGSTPRWTTPPPGSGSAQPFSPALSQQPFAQTTGSFQSVTPLQPGVVLNNTHRIDQMLGRGGMGEVYRGTNVHTNDQVAIKVIRPELVDDRHMRDLFLREAMALRKIRHPAIVSYEGASADASGRLYLVMDFVEGPSLGQVVSHQPLNPAQIRALRRRLAEGLQAAHDQNVVHRDLSPDNIILRGGDLNQATIIDFGIARRTDVAKTSLIGMSFAGKVEYAAPEQFGMFTGNADARSDVYALGLVLVAACLGHPIDMGSSAVAAIEARKKVPDLSRVPAELRPGFTRMLEPDPAARPQSMREVAALDGWDGAGGGRGGRGLRVALVAGGLALVAVGAAFAFADPVGIVRSLFDGGVSTEESQAWRQAGQADSAAGYQTFLTKYPNSKYAAEARQRMAAAQQRETAAREEQAWQQATQSDTASGYQVFLARYPSGKYAAEARQRLATAQQREAASREEQAWERATRSDTAAGYRAFLSQYPNSRFANEARTRLAAAQQRESGPRDEEELWRQAQAAVTVEPVQEYLRRYPDGRYAEQARRKLAGMLSSRPDPTSGLTWSPTSCSAIPLKVPPGFTCQVSSEYALPASSGRARTYAASGSVGGAQTSVWMHQLVGDGYMIVQTTADQSLRQLNAITAAGTDWSGIHNYGGAEYMTFRSGASNCMALRKPGARRDQGFANMFLAVHCAPPGQPLYPNDIRAVIDDVRQK